MAKYTDEEYAEMFQGGEPSDFWWLNSDDKIAERANQRATTLDDHNQPKFSAMQSYAKLYQGRMPVTSDRNGVDPGEDTPAVVSETGAVPKHNLVRTAIDAWVSIIGRQRPRPKLITSGGNWKTQMLAENLNGFLTGALPISNLYKTAPAALRDSAVCGLGVIRWSNDGEKMLASRVVPWHVIVDNELCANGEDPIEVFIRQPEHIKSLCHKYPDQADELKKQPGFGIGKRQVNVYEGWYLGEDNPTYVKFVGDVLLEREDIDCDDLPLQFLRYSEEITGFYGIGLAELLVGPQMRIDEILHYIAEMQRRYLRPTGFVDKGTGAITLSRVAGLEMDIVEVPGGKPVTIQVPHVIAPELYAEVERISDRAMQEHGISSFATNSQVPTGIESGPALREVSFKNMERHNLAAVRYEELFVEAGDHIIEGYSEIAAASKRKPKVLYANRQSVDMIEWPDVDLDDMCYSIRIEATALDSMSPSARTQFALELAQFGLLQNPAELRQLLGNPDIDASDRYSSAAFVKDAYWIIQQLQNGVALNPDPTMKLDVLLPMVQAAGREVSHYEDTIDIQDNINRFIDEAIMLQQQAAPAMPLPDEGMPVSNVARPAAQGLSGPGAMSGSSREGI